MLQHGGTADEAGRKRGEMVLGSSLQWHRWPAGLQVDDEAVVLRRLEWAWEEA